MAPCRVEQGRVAQPTSDRLEIAPSAGGIDVDNVAENTQSGALALDVAGVRVRAGTQVVIDVHADRSDPSAAP